MRLDLDGLCDQSRHLDVINLSWLYDLIVMQEALHDTAVRARIMKTECETLHIQYFKHEETDPRYTEGADRNEPLDSCARLRRNSRRQMRQMCPI
jgi:hypothetical protein